MAVREFNGTTDVINLSLGNCANLGGGDITIGCIVKLAGQDGGPWYLGSSNTETPRATIFSFAFNWYLQIDGTGQTTVSTTTDAWDVIFATKAAGTGVTPRGHKLTLGGSWSHQNGGGTLNNAANSGATMNLGRVFSDSLNGRLAVVGVWNSVLSDGQIEGLSSTLQAWLDLSPTGLWRLNQANVADGVTDLTGGGADQSSITGTTVVTGDDPPGFDFSLGGGPTLAPRAVIVAG